MENNNTFELAKDFVYDLHCYIPSPSIIDDYESFGEHPPTLYEFRRQVSQLESYYHSFIEKFKFSHEEINELEKIFYGGNSGIVKVGLYQASREYGGAEEGGWYYTNWYHIETKQIPYEEALKYIQQVGIENDDVYEHQGKQEAMLELIEGEHSKTGREYYC